jgi:hypothetical protein
VTPARCQFVPLATQNQEALSPPERCSVRFRRLGHVAFMSYGVAVALCNLSNLLVAMLCADATKKGGTLGVPP